MLFQGRTARIGNEGIATSLYNHEKNTDIASDLVKVLLENKQAVPDFLEELKPEGELVFDDDNSEEDEENQDTTVDADPRFTEPTAAEAFTEPVAASGEFSAPKQETTVEAPAAADDDFSW